MKKIILIILFLFIATLSFADDYWVYVRLEDRSAIDKSNDIYRSKAGDIVQILPDSPQFKPSEKELRTYAIFKVSDLAEEDIKNYTQEWTGEALRKNKIDIKDIEKGLQPKALKKDDFHKKIKQKTISDLTVYRIKRYVALAKYPFQVIGNKIIPRAIAESISTINKTGETYNTLTLWEDDVDGNLVSETRQETAECYDDDGTLSDALGIGGSTTNATYFLKITVPEGERHDGTVAQGFIYEGSNNSDHAIKIWDDHTELSWMIIKQTGVNSSSSYSVVYVTATDGGHKIHHNIFPTANNAGSGTIQYAIYLTDSSETDSSRIFNNIIYGIEGTGIWHSGGSDVSVFRMYNNTIYNCGIYGVYQSFSTGNTRAENNLVIDNGIEDYESTYGYDTWNNNGSGDSSGSEAGLRNLVAADEFADPTGGTVDLHLKAGATSIDEGGDLGAGNDKEIDIDGRDRDAEGDTWDIGADEYVEEPDNWCNHSANVGCWLMEDSGNESDEGGNTNNPLTETSGTIPQDSDRQFGEYSREFLANDTEYLTHAEGLDTDISGADQEITICAWFKWEEDNGASEAIVGKNDTTSGDKQYHIYLSGADDNELRFVLSNDGSAATIAEGGTLISTGTWYHVCGVYNDTDMRLYLNGSLDSNGSDNPKAYTSGIYDGDREFSVGCRFNASSAEAHFDGLIDEVAIFDTALTAANILDIYNNGLEGSEPTATARRMFVSQ